MSVLSDLREKLARMSARPWFVVGPPWNHGGPYITSGAEDPHVGSLVAELDPVADVCNENQTEDAEGIVALVNSADALIEAAEAARDYREHEKAEPHIGTSGYKEWETKLVGRMGRLDAALAKLGADGG
jgi:hypothetical protein